jgi:hypothetical protein
MHALNTQDLIGAPPSSPKLRAKKNAPLEDATAYRPVAVFWIQPLEK